MYYRRKILLNLLSSFGGQLESLRLQKLLFLFCQGQEKPNFDFVPYKYGCFSFQSYADLRTMKKYGHVRENENSWEIVDSKMAGEAQLGPNDALKLLSFKKKFGNMTAYDLIMYVYSNYPYYAINSEIAAKHLDAKGLARIEKERPKPQGKRLNTLGYEGVSVDSYLDRLIRAGVQTLVDVRKNPLSMKYGFSKKQLESSTEKIGIEYRHYPQLGIISDKRKNLETQEDYDKLFAEYEEMVIPQQSGVIEEIAETAQSGKNIALTCFEASPKKCHRARVANAVMSLIPEFEVNHL